MKARASRSDLLASGMDEEKAAALTRQQVRGHRMVQRRVGRRTGTTPHFAAWKAEGEIKSMLQRLKTAQLADSIENGTVAKGFALLSVGGFRNVWDVAQADRATLLDVRGIGIATLEHVEAYLKDRKVALKWSANA